MDKTRCRLKTKSNQVTVSETDCNQSLHLNLEVFKLLVPSQITVNPFNLEFRLHSYIGRYPWALVWYALRALDQPGRGYYEIPITLLAALINRDEKTIYRLLHQGRQVKAFRSYQVKGGILKVWLGALHKVCLHLELQNWGAVSVCNLLEIQNLRPLTTYTHTQRLQQKSRYAANSQVKPKYRKSSYGSPTANELIPVKQPSSRKPTKGQVPFVLWRSEKKLFVSQGFLVYGTSQEAIGQDLEIHETTVHRHLKKLNVPRRQVCQQKTEYSRIAVNVQELDSPLCTDTLSGRINQYGYKRYTTASGEEKVHFVDGSPIAAKKPRTPNRYNLSLKRFKHRFFNLKHRRYRELGTFMAKCNIYREQLPMKTMKASRREYAALVKQKAARGAKAAYGECPQ